MASPAFLVFNIFRVWVAEPPTRRDRQGNFASYQWSQSLTPTHPRCEEKKNDTKYNFLRSGPYLSYFKVCNLRSVKLMTITPTRRVFFLWLLFSKYINYQRKCLSLKQIFYWLMINCLNFYCVLISWAHLPNPYRGSHHGLLFICIFI